MYSLQLPSRTIPTDEQIENFDALNQRTRERMNPETPLEDDLCNQVVIALWHYRTNHSRASRLEEKCRKLEQSEPNSPKLAEMRSTITAALRQARRQKNFAWRRRGEYLTQLAARKEMPESENND